MTNSPTKPSHTNKYDSLINTIQNHIWHTNPLITITAGVTGLSMNTPLRNLRPWKSRNPPLKSSWKHTPKCHKYSNTLSLIKENLKTNNEYIRPYCWSHVVLYHMPVNPPGNGTWNSLDPIHWLTHVVPFLDTSNSTLTITVGLDGNRFNPISNNDLWIFFSI